MLFGKKCRLAATISEKFFSINKAQLEIRNERRNMKSNRKNQKSLAMLLLAGIIILSIVLAGCGNDGNGDTEESARPDITPGQVKGVFVSKVTGQPMKITPELFALTEGMTQAEKAALKVNEIEAEAYSSGEFLIKNVLPGRYALLIYSNTILSSTFIVSPGQTVDLGTIEVER